MKSYIAFCYFLITRKFKTFCSKQMAGQLSDFNCIFQYEILLLLKILEYLLHLYAEC